MGASATVYFYLTLGLGQVALTPIDEDDLDDLKPLTWRTLARAGTAWCVLFFYHLRLRELNSLAGTGMLWLQFWLQSVWWQHGRINLGRSDCLYYMEL